MTKSTGGLTSMPAWPAESVSTAQVITMPRLRIYLALALGILCIALSAIFTRLAAGVAYAGYLLSMQRIRVQMDTLSSLWIPGMTGAFLLLVFNLAAHQTLWGFSPRTYLMLLALGIISQVTGWLAINYALGHLPAAIVSATLLGQPVLTAIFAVPLLGEALGPGQLLGGLVALSGIYLVNRGFGRQ